MFELLSRTITPTGWPAPVVVRELCADDVMPLFMNGPVEPRDMQRLLVSLACTTEAGERLFPTPQDVGRVPARLFAGLAEITAAVMQLNVPATMEDTERPT